MPAICGSFATVIIASLYCAWRTYCQLRLHKVRVLRERVAYMLWVAADRIRGSSCPQTD